MWVGMWAIDVASTRHEYLVFTFCTSPAFEHSDFLWVMKSHSNIKQCNAMMPVLYQ